MNAIGNLGRGHSAILLAECGTALSKDGDGKAGLAEWTVFHDNSGQRSTDYTDDTDYKARRTGDYGSRSAASLLGFY